MPFTRAQAEARAKKTELAGRVNELMPRPDKFRWVQDYPGAR